MMPSRETEKKRQHSTVLVPYSYYECRIPEYFRKMVSEIAFGCGYDNLSNFNQQFKKIAGCSPNEYRKQSTRFVNPLDLKHYK